MNFTRPRSVSPLKSAAIAAALVATSLAAAPARAEQVYGLTVGSSLLSFDSATPWVTTVPTPITGLDVREAILGIDFRPATGQLYGLGSSSRLYTIDTTTAAATPVGAAGSFTLVGSSFGFDFNPVVDRIRVISDTNQNLRLNPNDGTLTSADTNITPSSSIGGAAYANNFVGSINSQLYVIDFFADTLGGLLSPNDGQVIPIGPLGVNADGNVGFDISGSTATAYASLNFPVVAFDIPALIVGGTGFYTINLGSGAATLVGSIGGGLPVADIAIVPAAVPEPASLALLAAASPMLLVRRRKH